MDISCQLVVGPPNSGKSKYCGAMSKLYKTMKQEVSFVNLDPAAENLEYIPDADIKDFTSVEDFADEVGITKAGESCLELVLDNIEWLISFLDNCKDGTVFIDCPGMSATSNSFSIISTLVKMLVSRNVKICYVYIINSQMLCTEFDIFSACIGATQISEMLCIPGINACSNMEDLEEDHMNFLSSCFQWDVLAKMIKNIQFSKKIPEKMFDVCFKFVNSKFNSEVIDDVGNQEVLFFPINFDNTESLMSIDDLFKVIVDDKNDMHDYLTSTSNEGQMSADDSLLN